SNALVSQCDGMGSYDWSYQVEDEPVKFALMAFSALSSSSDTKLSPTKPDQVLSHINRPTAPIIEDWVSDFEDESETKALQIISSFVQSFEQVKTTRHFVQPKMAQPTPRNYANRGNYKQYTSLTHPNPQKHMVPAAVLTQSKPVFNTTVRPVSAAMPKINVTRPRLAHPTVTKSNSTIRRHITYSQSPKTSNLPPRVIAVQAPVVSVAQGMQGK
nr:hypothetical protein [Tanacetum cinerariifolium]